jgi:hypothetical protein
VSTKSILLIQITRHSRPRAIHSVTSLSADLVRLIRTFLQRTTPDSAQAATLNKPFMPLPSRFQSRPSQQRGFLRFLRTFLHHTVECRPRQNELSLRNKYPEFGHLQGANGNAHLHIPPYHPCSVQKTG